MDLVFLIGFKVQKATCPSGSFLYRIFKLTLVYKSHIINRKLDNLYMFLETSLPGIMLLTTCLLKVVISGKYKNLNKITKI